MFQNEYVKIVIAMGIVTYLPRWMPLMYLSHRKLPGWLVEWLDLIPVAILSALLVPALMTGGEPRQIEWARPELLAAVPTFLVALKTKSLGATVLAGMAMFWLIGKTG